MKHTPGPWEVESFERKDGCIELNIHSKYGEVVGCEGIWFEPEMGNNKANAHLIAAAPDMFMELQNAIAQLKMCGDAIERGCYDEALLHARSLMRPKLEAIAKAKGETNAP